MNAFLRMQRDGVWTHGKRSTRWTVDPSKIQHGWVVLKEPFREALAPLDKPLPRKLRNSRQMFRFPLRSKTEILDYRCSSMGGMQAVDTLLVKIQKRIKLRKNFCPVVRLRSESYKHLKYGKIYVPLFEIVGWTGPTVVGRKKSARLNPTRKGKRS